MSAEDPPREERCQGENGEIMRGPTRSLRAQSRRDQLGHCGRCSRGQRRQKATHGSSWDRSLDVVYLGSEESCGCWRRSSIAERAS
jgi:hypothetical protein